MKIDVVYEKADILRLVTADLRRKGIKVKPGTMPAYKGALEIKLSVDADDDEVEAPTVEAPPTEAVETAPAPPNGGPPPPRKAPESEPTDMTDVLRQSRNMNQKDGPFAVERVMKRPLGPNEYEDFPEE